MAKTKTKTHSKRNSKDILRSTTAPLVNSPVKSRASADQQQQNSIEDLLTEAASLLEQSQPELALPLVEEALQRLQDEREKTTNNENDEMEVLLQRATEGKPTLPTALTLGADIYLALGDADMARKAFVEATTIDPDGVLVSAEPWLWLAQLNEEGGQTSIGYFEKGTEVLRNEIEVLEEAVPMEEGHSQTLTILDEKRLKLADALCGMAEVYMTDLSWEDDAEANCDRFVTEALAVCPERLSAGALQTLASVRISQERIEDARQALRRSMDLWKDLSPEDTDKNDEIRPDFASRISLSRLLMEVEAESDAIAVLEGLIKGDDQSVECWYLGGWCHVLLGQKSATENASPDLAVTHQEQALQWLNNSLRLYRLQEYEDDRLRDHALELKQSLLKALKIDGEHEADDDLWEDEDDEDDEEEEKEEEDDDDDEEEEIKSSDILEDGDVEMS